jgi:V/A-type H+-transporting ATPase subunit I
MIVPMKKVTLVLLEETKKSSLKSLRKAGVLHIEREFGAGSAPEHLTENAELVEKAILTLPDLESGSGKVKVDINEAVAEARSVLALREDEQAILKTLSGYAADQEVLEPWGDFEPADLRILSAKGIDIRLVEVEAGERQNLADDRYCEFIPLRTKKNITYGVAVYRECAPEGAVEGIDLPENGIIELKTLINEKHEELQKIKNSLEEKSRTAGPVLLAAADLLDQEIEFEEIRDSLAGEDKLAWFTGYVPVDDVESIKTLASEESWGLMISDPGPDDTPPSLVKNPAAIRIINPVFRLMGIFPGYREADISIWFLTFLSIFVAMILGDAAYGIIILALVTIARIKIGKSSDVLKLMTVFGVTTFIWGALSGTWFSSLPLVRDTPLRNLVIPALATYQQELFPDYVTTMGVFPGDSLNSADMVKWISLLFGVVMLSIARIQSFIMKMPSLRASAQLGWLCIVLALYWLIMQLVLQLTPIPFIMDLILPVIIAGFALILVFGGQEKGRSFFSGIIQGLKDLLPTALSSIGAFGDIISFIRLFAVGLAGVALSQSFNSMAPKGGGFAIVAAILILTLGHALNLVLSALSVLVHGVRLNVLEFSGHLDMEWAGIGFEPFRLRVPESESPETK